MTNTAFFDHSTTILEPLLKTAKDQRLTDTSFFDHTITTRKQLKTAKYQRLIPRCSKINVLPHENSYYRQIKTHKWLKRTLFNQD